MKWTLMVDKQPTEKDLPFITMHYRLPNSDITFEHVNLWDDADWFVEVSNSEKFMWKYWTPIIDPEDG